MDEHERVTITPDVEFHQRLSQTTASGSTDPSQTDPKQIDLSNAAHYDGTPLFATSSDEQTNATQAASAIGQTTAAVGIAPATTRIVRTAGGTFAAQTPTKYTAYSDLPSMNYSPVNAAANQGLSTVNPVGVTLTASGYSKTTPSDAANQIDALTGDEVMLITAASATSFFSKLRDAWNTIKKDAQKVAQVVISVAKDIAIGIQFVVDGVTKVVKAIANDVKDLMASIGSFFVQLGKDILKAIEALSLLLHLGEVIKTAGIIKTQINAAFDDISGLLKNSKTTVDNWFDSAEQKITNEFCDLFSAMGLPTPAECAPSAAGILSTPLNSYGSMGATPTTVYNTNNTSGQSNSVQHGWSSHSMRTNMGGSSELPSAAATTSFDDLTSLLDGFVTSLTNDPNLSQAYSAVGNAFSNTFKSTSVEQFFAMALEDILEVIKAVAITGVAIGRAVVDTVLNVADTVVNGLQAMGNINIPILSFLWKKITGNDLSFLDLLSFVLAFPVTLIYRAVEGHYPSQDLSASAVNASLVSNLMGIVGSLAMLLGGVVTTVLDSITVLNSNMGIQVAPAIGWKIAGLLLLIANAASNIYKAVPGQTEAISLAWLSSASVVMTLLSIKVPQIGSGVNVLLSGITIYMYVEKFKATSDTALTLAREIVGTVPGIVNPIKFAGNLVGLISPAADLTCRTAAGAIQMLQTIEAWNTLTEEPPPAEWRHDLYFPLIADNVS